MKPWLDVIEAAGMKQHNYLNDATVPDAITHQTVFLASTLAQLSSPQY